MQFGELVEVIKPFIGPAMTIVTWAWSIFVRRAENPEKSYVIERRIVVKETYTISAT